MPTPSSAEGWALLHEVGQRWHSTDPLLPIPALPAPDKSCGALFAVPGPDRQPYALGRCEHWHGAVESLELTWGAARRFQLTAFVGGPDVAAALDELLDLWRVHQAGVAGADDPDSAAVVLWPSRDIDGIRPLLRHGFAPRSVVAARHARRLAANAMGPPDHSHRLPGSAGVAVRRAGLTDIDTVCRLGLEVIRYDAHFGGVIERPSTATALRVELATILAEPQPWIWLAELDRSPIGLLIGERPPVQWIAPLVGVEPVAYNMLTWVAPEARGGGTATALVESFHQSADAVSASAMLLHYEQTNPLSAPFWARQGYRPLWTSWEARPACTVR